jgi:hypothetical protein
MLHHLLKQSRSIVYERIYTIFLHQFFLAYHWSMKMDTFEEFEDHEAYN